jgi:peptidoglycan/xylan/chitin deacetylase (PgdA/CDA1 family)
MAEQAIPQDEPDGAVRRQGSDHDLYDYRPFPAAPRFRWPDDARLAVTVTLFVDYRALVSGASANPDSRIVSPLGANEPDWATWSLREYGARVGAFRILDELDRHGFRPSVALGAAAAVRHPELVDACLQCGAAFLGHGTHADHRISSMMSEDEERELIATSRDAVHAATGHMPTGWAGQDFNESQRTPNLLAEMGFDYTTDWANDDRPYLLGAGSSRLVALPAQIMWNDLEAMWLRRVTPDDWSAAILAAAEALHAEGGTCLNIGLHPFVAGQPYRRRALRQALAGIAELPGIWRATTDEVAAAARAQMDGSSS